MVKKIHLIYLIVVLMFVGILSANAYDYSENYNKIIARNDKMLEVANKIYDLLENSKYLDYYGGIYINENIDGVILQIVKESIPNPDESEYQEYEKLVNIDPLVSVEYVKHSYNKLLSVYEFINKYYEEVDYNILASGFQNFSSYYVDVINNRVVVRLYDYSANDFETINEEKLKFLSNEFKLNVVDSDVLFFEKGALMADEATTIKTGGPINLIIGNCSMGFRAKVNNKKGYVTAAHCVSGLNAVVPSGTVKKYKLGGKVDAAFVQTTSSFAPSNTLFDPLGLINTLDSTMTGVVTVGSAVAHVGYVSGYESGTILSTNFSANYSGVAFTNLITTNYVSTDGDSGGAVFIPTTQNKALLIGIHKGSENATTKVVVNANYIYQEFSYVRY